MSELNFAKTFLQSLDAKPSKYPANHVFDPKIFPTRRPPRARGSQFTLPKLPGHLHPPYPRSTPTKPTVPGVTRNVDLTLKSSRNPALTVTIPSLDPSTITIDQLKKHVQRELNGDILTDKIKILYNKKPVSAAGTTVSDLLRSDGGGGAENKTDGAGKRKVEMGVMIIGGAPDPLPPLPRRQAQDTPSAENTIMTDAMLEQGQSSQKAQTQAQAQTTTQPRTTINDNENKDEDGDTRPNVLNSQEFWTDLQGFLEQRIKDRQLALDLVRSWKEVGAGPTMRL